MQANLSIDPAQLPTPHNILDPVHPESQFKTHIHVTHESCMTVARQIGSCGCLLSKGSLRLLSKGHPDGTGQHATPSTAPCEVH